MKTYRVFVLLVMVITFSFGFSSGRKSPFSVKETDQGIELFENGHPVFDYQRKPKSLTGEYICNNYIHPLYSIEGDTLTDEFPADHIFHRGIFWSWHQLFIDNKSIGDGWIMKDIALDVFKLKTIIGDSTSQIDVDVHWKSSIWQNGKPFVDEHTTILVHQLKAGLRAIDFVISLKALVPGVSIGGSDDEKGYGGFSTRIKLPEDLIFTSGNGPVIPQNLPINASSWMDFSGSFGSAKKKCGITLISLCDAPDYPTQWILRKEGSMQNIVFPGRKRIDLLEGQPIVLKYRLIIHSGNLTQQIRHSLEFDPKSLNIK